MTSFAVSGGGADSDYMNGVAVDSAGAAVAAGSFYSSATFGGVVLSSAGSTDAVVWKQSAEGTTLWIVHGGGLQTDYLSGVAVDSVGAVVAAGYFYSSQATFGSGSRRHRNQQSFWRPTSSRASFR